MKWAVGFIDQHNFDVDYKVVEMTGWQPNSAPGYGWPENERSWVNPSPNAPTLNMARAYAGTVLLEGVTLSEGRGTTRALEVFGAPDISARDLLLQMENSAPHWLKGCQLRECWFEPTFHKHKGELCHGFQIHADNPNYVHEQFKPWRIIALALHSVRKLYPDYEIWREFHYEYEADKLAFDVINGSELLRQWIDDPKAHPADLEQLTAPDEEAWRAVQKQYSIY